MDKKLDDIFSVMLDNGERKLKRKKRGKLENLLKEFGGSNGNDFVVSNLKIFDKDRLRIDILYKAILRDFRKFYI